MKCALDLHSNHGRSANRAQEHATQRIADCDSETTLKGLGDESTVALGECRMLDLDGLRSNQLTPVAIHVSPLFGGVALPQRQEGVLKFGSVCR